MMLVQLASEFSFLKAALSHMTINKVLFENTTFIRLS